jgi:hypothetical protein
MGLSSFNRMRREKAEVEKMEAERFKAWNAQHNASRIDRDNLQKEMLEHTEDLAKAEAEAAERIGEKNREGIKRGDDLPLRKDHAAEIAGRNLEGVDEPIDPVERIERRIPQHETANEQLVEHMGVETEGPSAELVQAAAEEVGSVKPESKKKSEDENLPAAAAPGESVAPQGETNTGDKSADVKVPSDWEDMHWTQQVKLAEDLSGSEVKETDGKTKVEVAREIIASKVNPS